MPSTIRPDVSSLTGGQTTPIYASRAAGLSNITAMLEASRARTKARSTTTSSTKLPQAIEIDPTDALQDFNKLYSEAQRNLDRELSSARSEYTRAKADLQGTFAKIKEESAWATDPTTFTKPFVEAFDKTRAALQDTYMATAKRAVLDLEAYERNNPDQRPGAAFAVRRDVTAGIVGEVSRATAQFYDTYAKNVAGAMEVASGNQIAISGILAQGATAMASLAADYINVRSSVAANAFSISVGAAEALANITAGLLEANQRAGLQLEAQRGEERLATMQGALEQDRLSVQERIAEIQARAANPFQETASLTYFDQNNPIAAPSLRGRKSFIFDPLTGQGDEETVGRV